jgi:hypothetical protein
MRKNGKTPGGAQQWQCQVLAARRKTAYNLTPRGIEAQATYDASDGGRARSRRYEGTVGGVDRKNRRQTRLREERIGAIVAEIQAIQKRIRDAN